MVMDGGYCLCIATLPGFGGFTVTNAVQYSLFMWGFCFDRNWGMQPHAIQYLA